MGFLKQFFRTVFREGSIPAAGSSFEHIDREALEEHLAVSQYGTFQLTEAIRPSYDLKVMPEEGFRYDEYRDVWDDIVIPVLIGSVGREKLFDTFIELLDPLGEIVDVVLESSHTKPRGGHVDFIRESIDLPVLKSVLYDFEDLLMNDGCTGIAVLNPAVPQEVQFDEHKLLVVYGERSPETEGVFIRHRISRREKIRFITEAEHVHSSRQSYQLAFEELKMQLGMDGLN